MTVEPDYGFGIVKPNKTKSLKIIFSPESNDLPLTNIKDSVHEFIAKIALSTIKDVGGIKEEYLRNEFKKCKRQMKKSGRIINDRGDTCSCPDTLRCLYEVLPEEYYEGVDITYITIN